MISKELFLASCTCEIKILILLIANRHERGGLCLIKESVLVKKALIDILKTVLSVIVETNQHKWHKYK